MATDCGQPSDPGSFLFLIFLAFVLSVLNNNDYSVNVSKILNKFVIQVQAKLFYVNFLDF